MLGIILQKLFKHPEVYISAQSIIGADRLRTKCIEIIGPKPEDCVLDIGCGPGQVLDLLPNLKKYYGFDTEANYIKYASAKYSGRGHFFCNEFNDSFLEFNKIDPVDKVFLLGIFHHIPDLVASKLLQTIHQVLKPGGSVVSLDPCFVPNQSFISTWVAKNDRGRFVRDEQGYLKILKENSFSDIKTHILKNTCRIPSTEIIMHFKKTASAPSEEAV